MIRKSIKIPTKLANKIWTRYINGSKTFSHSLSVYSKENVEMALAAINSCELLEENKWNPTKAQFIDNFIRMFNREKKRKQK